MGKISGLGLGEIAKISGLGLGEIKKISGLGLGRIWPEPAAPAGMVHSGAAVALTPTLAQIGGWVADSSWPGSVVTGDHTLVVDGGPADLLSSVKIANSGGVRSVTVEVRVNGSAVASATANLAAFASGQLYVADTPAPIDVPEDAAVTYWARAAASFGTATVLLDATSYVWFVPES